MKYLAENMWTCLKKGKNKIVLFIFLTFSFYTISLAQNNPTYSSSELFLLEQGMVNIHDIDSSIRTDVKYATNNNFTNQILYDSIHHIFLHPLAAHKLAKAQSYLKQINPTLSFLVFDGVRPLSIQKKMYDVVRDTKYAAYVANPQRTGLHNYGMAVDITLCDLQGNELDMGTPFDFFGRAAGITEEQELVNLGILTQQQLLNRKLLRKIMQHAGFLTIRGEWWHFNAVPLSEAKSKHKLIE